MYKDARPIMDALRAQKWVLETTKNNHVRAIPPDKSQPAVCFAPGSNDPRSLKNILRDLKRSGFIWPYKPGPRAATKAAFDKVFGTDVHNASPEAVEEIESQEEVSVDVLYQCLKEARDYYALTKEEEEAAARRLQEAQEEVDEAHALREQAAQALREAKKRFDEMFSAEAA